MPDWLVEPGLGETRAALVEGGEIIAARIVPEGSVPAGTILRARLARAGTHGRNALAVAEGGSEYLLPRGARGMTEGARLAIEVTREAIPGSEPWKLPLARVHHQGPAAAATAQTPKERTLPFPAPRDELGEAGWNGLLEEVRSGLVRFPGGELRVAMTPAMTIIDVDGYLEPEELAISGARAAARAILRLDIGGSIGIDLPTVAGKGPRQAAAEAIDNMLPRPFERTAVNGFGFVQIIRPRTRASLIELASDRAMFEARALLRRLAFETPGAKSLVAHPAVVRALEQHAPWLQTLSLQVGGVVGLRADPSLPISGGYAEPA